MASEPKPRQRQAVGAARVASRNGNDVNKTHSSTPTLDDIDHLHTFSIEQLRDHWAALYGTAPSVRIGRGILVRAIAYRIQENLYGGLTRAERRELAGYAMEVERTGKIAPTERTSLSPGMKLIREWNGRTQEVEVLAGGFSWSGKHYGSLSQVACAITGTHWSGPRFFGIEAKPGQVRVVRAGGPPKGTQSRKTRKRVREYG